MACLSQVMWVFSASPDGGFACPYLSQRTLGSVDGELMASLSVLHCAVSRVPWTFQVLLLVSAQGCRGLQHTTDTSFPQKHGMTSSDGYLRMDAASGSFSSLSGLFPGIFPNATEKQSTADNDGHQPVLGHRCLVAGL